MTSADSHGGFDVLVRYDARIPKHTLLDVEVEMERELARSIFGL